MQGKMSCHLLFVFFVIMLSNSLIQLKTLDRQMPVNISGNTQLEGPLKLCSGQGWTRVLQHRTSPPRIGEMDSERTGVI